MLSIDWRSPSEYRHTQSIAAGGFAWEYLRRDDYYHRAYLTITHTHMPSVEQFEAFAQRWGLRFPHRP